MPSNNILINNSLSYQVSDSKMDELLNWLDGNAYDKRVKGTNNRSGIEEVVILCSQPES